MPLRLCNELLRRLSRAEDAVFCGRVFFFLFQSFPLGDPSSVNLRGEFHTDNVTNYEGTALDSSQDVRPREVDGKPNGESECGQQSDAVSATSKAVTEEPTNTVRDAAYEENSKLYPIFWSLQQYFSVPTRLFDDSHFSSFKQGLEAAMRKFEETPAVVQTKSVSEEPRGRKRKLGDDVGHQYGSNYNAKYLTSRDLFELEVSSIRRQESLELHADHSKS